MAGEGLESKEHDVSMEQELQSQLLEQEAALEQVQEALQQGGEDVAELQQMADELKTAIQELEAALLEIKRARLLATVAAAQQGQVGQSSNGIPQKAAAGAAGGPAPLVLLPPSATDSYAADVGLLVAPQPVDGSLQGSGTAVAFPVGAPCRFRGEDGRWYQGHVHSTEGSWAHMNYDMPTQRYMLQGCRVLASSLRGPRTKPFRAVYEVGDVVYIRPSSLEGLQVSSRPAGRAHDVLWPAADVVEIDDMRGIATVQLWDGRRLQLEFEAITSGAHAGCSDLEAHMDSSDGDHTSTGADSAGDESSSSSGEGEQELEAEGHSGLGSSLDTLGHARLALAAGVHTGTRHFASWEAHTRGIASKLMAKMGYKAGIGLGSTGQGLAAPVEVLLFNEKSGLGASEGRRPAGHGDHKHLKRKRSRKKAATKAREAREAERESAHQQELAGGVPGLFGFINNALGDNSEAAAAIRRVEHGLLRQDRVRPGERGAAAQQAQDRGRGTGRAATVQDSRKGLMDMHKAIEGCHAKVAHFQAMLQRNATNVTLAPQIAANLKQAQAELAAAQAEQSRMTSALKKTDQQRKMLKF